MEIEKVISTLDDYYSELESILNRFSKTRNGIHIDQQDGYRMREIATELVDFINDHVPNSKHHAATIANYYNQGISNWGSSAEFVGRADANGGEEPVI